MSGFLGRLAQRGQGGTQLASLPTIRPMPAIYGAAAPSSEQRVETVQSDVDLPGMPRREQETGPASHRPETEPRPAEASPRALGRQHAAPERREPLRPLATAAGQNSGASSPAAPFPIEQRSIQRPQTEPKPEREVRANRPGQILQSRLQSMTPAEQEHVTQERQRVVASPSEPVPESASAFSPPRARSGLERLFETIEAADEAGVISNSAAARRPDVPAVPNGEEGPVVSIGRITISVAPPPVAPPAPPAGPPRSQGFSAYARLRGGYER